MKLQVASNRFLLHTIGIDIELHNELKYLFNQLEVVPG